MSGGDQGNSPVTHDRGKLIDPWKDLGWEEIVEAMEGRGLLGSGASGGRGS